jgi:hypothetical protein
MPTPKTRRRRQRTSARTKLIVAAAKAVRAEKLAFEREASAILSEALGFEVTVKIKRQRLGEGLPAGSRRAARKSGKAVRAELAAQLAGAVAREPSAGFARTFLELPDDAGKL